MYYQSVFKSPTPPEVPQKSPDPFPPCYYTNQQKAKELIAKMSTLKTEEKKQVH